MTTIGVLGGGQLGRMLILAGAPLGLRFRVLDHTADAPAGRLAELVVGDFTDPATLDRFAAGLDLVTLEFENVPLGAARSLAERLPVYPPPRALEVAQDRVREKRCFQELGIPTPDWRPAESASELRKGVAELGLPVIAKTQRLGYDGKGQRVLRSEADVGPTWDQLGGRPLIVETLVPFEREVSILAVRCRHGKAAHYPLVENVHEHGILRRSQAPALYATGELQVQAQNYAKKLLEALDYVGVLAIEFFVHGGRLLANEMAPRVHNSGHWTIEGAETSQFENHLRAILGWPLGSTAPRGHSVMYNLIGTLPPMAPVLRIEGTHVHLYGKAPRPGRKLGHITVRADDAETLEARVQALQESMNRFEAK